MSIKEYRIRASSEMNGEPRAWVAEGQGCAIIVVGASGQGDPDFMPGPHEIAHLAWSLLRAPRQLSAGALRVEIDAGDDAAPASRPEAGGAATRVMELHELRALFEEHTRRGDAGAEQRPPAKAGPADPATRILDIERIAAEAGISLGSAGQSSLQPVAPQTPARPAAALAATVIQPSRAAGTDAPAMSRAKRNRRLFIIGLLALALALRIGSMVKKGQHRTAVQKLRALFADPKSVMAPPAPASADTKPLAATPAPPSPSSLAAAASASAPSAAPSASAGPRRTIERQAADAVATGDWKQALALYEMLTREHPDNPAYREAALILRAKIGTTPAASQSRY